MKKIAGLALAALLATSVSAMAMGPRLAAHNVEGYLDQAPAGAQVVEKVMVKHGDSKRMLVIVKHDQPSSEIGISSGINELSTPVGALELRGTSEQISRVMASPTGTHVLGFFVQPRSYPVLIVGSVETDAPVKALAAGALPANQG